MLFNSFTEINLLIFHFNSIYRGIKAYLLNYINRRGEWMEYNIEQIKLELQLLSEELRKLKKEIIEVLQSFNT